MVSGGDIRVVVAAPPSGLRFTVNGKTQTVVLTPDPRGMSCVVRGLRKGPKRIGLSAPGWGSAELKVVNHPLSRPIFSGKQLDPWICLRPIDTAEYGRKSHQS